MRIIAKRNLAFWGWTRHFPKRNQENGKHVTERNLAAKLHAFVKLLPAIVTLLIIVERHRTHFH
jgi:hypothetical protein